MYVRFIVHQRDESSDAPGGVFTAIYDLVDRGELLPHELAWFREMEGWFNEHLKRPARLAWSRRPNAPRRALSWFKASATAHVTRMRELVALLEHKDVAVREVRSERPGYIVFEDAFQVAAIPFADTPGR